MYTAKTTVAPMHPVLYRTVLYCTVLYCTVLYCTVHTVLYCTVLYCTVLYCTVLYFGLRRVCVRACFDVFGLMSGRRGLSPP